MHSDQVELIARQALEQIEHGRVEGVDRALAELSVRANDPGARAWSLAIRAHRSIVAPSSLDAAGLEPPAPVTDATSPTERRAGAWTCIALERAALLATDRDALERLLALHDRCAGADDSGELALRASAGRLWSRVLDGDQDIEESCRSVVQTAGRLRLADVVVETTALRALAALGRDEPQPAVALARRAARMARTEAMPEPERMACFVLARVRRSTGQPHLALRILTALARVVPPRWRPWLEWELLFAGATRAPGAGTATALVEILDAARGGDRARFDRAVSAQESALAWADRARERDALVAALDPQVDPSTMEPPLRAWALGETPVAARGLLGAASPGEGETALAHVVTGPYGVPRRCLSDGVALVGDESALRLARMQRRQGRLDTAAAVLALAGAPGLEATHFFREVYGFPFAPALHRGALDVLVHRLRERLHDGAVVHRTSERLVLEPRRVLVLPDPRCAPLVGDRILRLLAVERRASARDAAKRLGVPLRTVQTALRELVADGACSVQRDRGRVEYGVQEPTFSDTTTRLGMTRLPE